MTQRVGPLLAVAWCVVAPLITAGCAGQRSVATTPAAADSTTAHDPVTLRVTNSNWSDVRIYVSRGTMWVRLGTVTTNSTGEFTVPAEFLTYAGTVNLIADPVAGRSVWTSPLPAIQPGDEFELVIENFLQYSHLVVR